MYTKEFIAQQLAVNNEWLVRGISAIYKYQTNAEQNAGQTHENNGVGFNGIDSVILSSFAEQIKTWQDTPVARRRFPIPLSVKQLALARKKMLKYAGQLARIANERTAVQQAPVNIINHVQPITAQEQNVEGIRADLEEELDA